MKITHNATGGNLLDYVQLNLEPQKTLYYLFSTYAVVLLAWSLVLVPTQAISTPLSGKSLKKTKGKESCLEKKSCKKSCKCDDVERKARIANCNTDRKLALTSNYLNICAEFYL